MTVKIAGICGRRGFFREGDGIISIDGKKVVDQLDIYYLLSGVESAVFRIERANGSVAERRIRTETFERAAPVFEEMKFIRCSSKCIFCFVDQMPEGLRDTLYFKDDDYRLSFLFGNYITLNDITSDQLKRIIDYNLSPLFVSVHATRTDERRKLFGRPMKNDIMDVLSLLVNGGITIHAQIVLVPGINDGRILEGTVEDLFGLYPGCKTLAVVPVGLTGHRKGLTSIGSVDATIARTVLDMVEEYNGRFREATGGEDYLFASDEFYLLSGRKLPLSARYGEYEQLANGVGMSRQFVDMLMRRISNLKRRVDPPAGKMTVVTGKLGGKLLRRYILPVVRRELPGLEVKILTIDNRTFGNSVTVSGLISGSDIEGAVRRAGGVRGPLILPPNVLNHEGKMIDDMLPGELSRRLGMEVVIPEEHFLENVVLRSAGAKR